MNSPYKHELVSNDYRYIDWSAAGAHPKVLNHTDLDALKKTDDLFARKVNTEKSGKLLDELDQFILASAQAATT